MYNYGLFSTQISSAAESESEVHEYHRNLLEEMFRASLKHISPKKPQNFHGNL